jgi:hypothetical protein
MPRLIEIAGIGIAATLVGCGGPAPSAPVAPSDICHRGTAVSLGRPGPDSSPSRFSTSEGTYLIGAVGFEHGGPLDPTQGATEISLGSPEAEPTYDRQAGTFRHATQSLTVVEGRLTPVHLEAGEHWLVTTNIVEVTMTPCLPARLSVSPRGS